MRGVDFGDPETGLEGAFGGGGKVSYDAPQPRNVERMRFRVGIAERFVSRPDNLPTPLGFGDRPLFFRPGAVGESRAPRPAR